MARDDYSPGRFLITVNVHTVALSVALDRAETTSEYERDPAESQKINSARAAVFRRLKRAENRPRAKAFAALS
jgi:hypothetical protein